MQETEIITELFKEPNSTFLKHLELDNNERIIFSGKFGMGKTTFLSHFFNSSKPQNKYNVFHLFPVNYSVATNEDIFRYIKYDIVYEMLRLNVPIESYDLKFLDTLPDFFKKNIDKIAAALVYMIPIVGKNAVESYERLKPLLDDFINKHNELQNGINEGDQLIKYLDGIELKEGTIFENDIITQLIENVLNRIKENNNENILIIDDLDRLDPEHIFRILNVFAAHFDRKHTTKNKFGFDKVIFVCDIVNVKNIFMHKYGINVDFNGYIDKFYSHSVFNYANLREFRPVVRRILQIKTIDSYSEVKIFYNHPNVSFFSDLIQAWAENGQIDLRNILKWNKNQIVYPSYYELNSGLTIETDDYPIISFIILLREVKGDANALIDSIVSIKNNFKIDYDEKNHITTQLLNLLYSNRRPPNTEPTYIRDLNGKSIAIRFKKNSKSRLEFTVANYQSFGHSFSIEDTLELMIEAIDFLQRYKII